MGDNGVNYKAVVADLLAKRARIDAALIAIQEFAERDGDDGSSPKEKLKEIILPVSREYRGMTIAAATLKFLRTVGKPQLTGDISRALKMGGIGSTSKNMYRTVYNTLNNRMDKHKDIVKSGPKWGLAEWNTP
ncbi:MAG: hypothetical protein WAM79_03320 [Candidatus Sulfotelmatobacter sp.]